MAGEPQPLANNFAIVKSDGTPTDYFIRWAQDRQIDIENGITTEQAEELINDWAAERDIIAGVALSGGGSLAADVTINHGDSPVVPDTYGDATHVAQITVDQQGHVTGVAEVVISGGGGGGLWWFDPPAAADFPTIVTGTANNPTVTDDADTGMILSWVGSTGSNNDESQGCFKALPAGVDWTLETHFNHQSPPQNYRYGGLSIRNTVANKSYTFGFIVISGQSPIFIVLGQTGQTGQQVNTNLNWVPGPIFIKAEWVQSTGTLNIYFSSDGKHWSRIYQVLGSAYLGGSPDQIGFKAHCAISGGLPDNQYVICDRWVQSW